MNPKQKNDYDCLKAELFQTSKDVSIEWGDLAITFKTRMAEITIKTCMVVHMIYF